MIKKLIHTVLAMCEPAYDMLRATLILSCVMLFCAFIILIDIGQVNTDTYTLYLCAKEMASAPTGLLLIAAIGTVCIEERSPKRPY